MEPKVMINMLPGLFRELGHYHVTYNGNPDIAKFCGKYWWIVDMPFSLKEEEFDEIRGMVTENS